MRRTIHQGSDNLLVERQGLYYVFTWNGKKYVLNYIIRYTTSPNGEEHFPPEWLLNMQKADFRISKKDLENKSISYNLYKMSDDILSYQ